MPTLTALSNGNFASAEIIFVSDGPSPSDRNDDVYQVVANVYDTAGNQIGEAIILTPFDENPPFGGFSTGTLRDVDVVALDDGRFAVGWETLFRGGSVPSYVGYQVQTVGADGTLQGINRTAFSVEGIDPDVTLAGLSDGGYRVDWSEDNQFISYSGSATFEAVRNQTITGTTGDDVLVGGLGNDEISGLDGNDRLEGRGGTDTLFGGAGNDFLNYAAVAVGGTGDDTYQNVFLTGIVENADEGTDTIISYSGFVIPENIENLIMTTTGYAWATGNALDNVITGGSGDNTLLGADGNDTLIGGAAFDMLDGGGGIDTVDYSTAAARVAVNLELGRQNTGGSGIDVLTSIENLTGSGFNDALRGNGAANVLAGGAGNDNLLGFGGDDTLIGGVGRDTLKGDLGDDVLRGGDGADVLTGGEGRDLFVLESTGGTINRDAIKDFVSGTDRIALDNSVFAALSDGALTSSAFTVAPRATTADQHIIYNSVTGMLFYDVDGVGGVAQVQIAQLTAHPALAVSDILVL